MQVISFVALAAGAAHVFRRDIAKVVGVLRKPTENFIKEVKSEIDANKGAAAAIGAAAKAGEGAGAQAAAAANTAAEQTKESLKRATGEGEKLK